MVIMEETMVLDEFYALLNATYKDGIIDVYELHEAVQLLNVKVICQAIRNNTKLYS